VFIFNPSDLFSSPSCSKHHLVGSEKSAISVPLEEFKEQKVPQETLHFIVGLFCTVHVPLKVS
jgi:hypothetical protein